MFIFIQKKSEIKIKWDQNKTKWNQSKIKSIKFSTQRRGDTTSMHCVHHVDFVVFTTLSLEEARRWRIIGFHRGRKITFLKERCRCTLNKVLNSYSFNMRIFRLALFSATIHISVTVFSSTLFVLNKQKMTYLLFALCSIASVRKARHLILACVDWFV